MTAFLCRTCGDDQKKNFYKTARYQCKSCWNKRTAASQKEKVLKVKKQYGGKCIKCGYDKSLEALVFHHRDPMQKEFNLGAKRGYSIEKLKPELDKCDLICSNCHIEIHSGEYHSQIVRESMACPAGIEPTFAG